jgi:hypothetical protein
MWTIEQAKDYAEDSLISGNVIDVRDIERHLPEGWELEDWELVSDKTDSPGWYHRLIRMDVITMTPTSHIARQVFRNFVIKHWCWSGQFDIDLIAKVDHQLVRVRHFEGVTVSDIMGTFPHR